MEIECRPLYLSAYAPCNADNLIYFSECTVFGNVTLQSSCGCELCIESASAEPVIENCKLITTLRGESLEGQRLSGKKLLINGYLQVKLVRNYCGNLSVIHESIPFSTYIVIPEELCSETVILLKYFIEDISTEILEKGKVLISVSTLFVFSDEHIRQSVKQAGG